MAKKLLATGFRIDRDNNAIYINGNILLQRLLLITDVTTNRIIYNFADEGSGVLTREYNVDTNETKFVFRLSLAALNVVNTDILQILVENESTEIRPEDPFIDPVSKLRISQPENLIDTDFEYGLQTTKWETLKLVNNVPSFYSKNGANAISVSSVQATQGSTTVLVSAPAHGLTAGSPFEITGLSNSQFEGGYIVTSVISVNQFTYQLTFAPLNTLELSTVYTAVIPGAFYFGSQITVSDIETNGLNPSHLIVKTKFPHGFSLNTPFYFLNTVAIYRQDIPINNFNVDDTTTNEKATNSTSIAESVLDYRITSVTPYRFVGKGALYWDNTNLNTDINAPISSARIVNGGAGYVSNPVATPVFVSTAVFPTVNSVTFNATATGVVVGTGANAGRITTAAHTFVTGDRVEYHMEGAAVASLVGSTSLIRDPHRYVSSNLFMGEQSVTEGTVGYSPSAFGTGASFQGASTGQTTALLSMDTSSYYGRIEPGMEIRVFSISSTTTTAPTLLLPEGTTISSFSITGTLLQVVLEFPFPLSTGINFAATTAWHAASISSARSTIRTDNHGFVTGDRVYYRRVVTATGTVNANSPALATIGGLTDSTSYFVIRIDSSTFRLATTYVNAMRGIYIKITNIGSGAFNSVNGRFLPGHVFIASSDSLYARVLSSTTLQLHSTRNDALNNTNVITITTAGTGTAQRISAAPAVFSTTVTGSTVSSISTIDSGSSYDKNASITVSPYIETRSLNLSGFSGGTRASGTTNSLTFKTNLYDRPIYAGMLVSGTGIAAGAVVNTVSVPDVNNNIVVQISANINANITHGQLISFADNPGTTANIVPNIRVSCFNVPGHGYNLGDSLWFYNPPGNTFPSSLTACRVYFVYPIDNNNFALLTALTFPAGFTQANSNARVVLNTGTVLNDRKFVATRSFRITGNNATFVQVDADLNVSYGLNVNDAFIITNTTGNGTLGSTTITNAVDATTNNAAHTIYFARSITQSGANSLRELTFATTTTGAVVSTGARSGEVFITPIVLLAESDSIYIPNHGFLNDDYVIYTATNTSIEGVNPYTTTAGVTLAAAGFNGYLIDKVSDDRFKIKRRDTGTVVDLRGFGTGTHTFTNIKYSALANTVNKTNHGFLANQTVIYDSAGAPIVDGLRNTFEYFIRPVNIDNFRVSTTTQELAIAAVSKAVNASSMTITFNTNHSLTVGDSLIIRDNPNSYMNGYWTVATVPATPTINAAPSTITVSIPVFTNPAPAVTQNAATGVTYGIAYSYVDFAFVTARRSVITPVPAGKTFTTLKAIDRLLDKKTPSANGGGIVTNHLVRSSDVLPFESKVSAVTGVNIRTARILFKPRDILSAVRNDNVVTVTTTLQHGYNNNQTVMIQGLPTTSFNTASPVTITTTGTNTFTFAQNGSNETATIDADSIVVMALTSAQAALLSSVGHDANTGANNVTLAAGAVNATSITATVATATQISNVTKTLVANAGLVNQYTLIVPDTIDLKPGMPVVGSGINTDARILRILSPTQIELTAPNTANTTASTYTFFKIQAGQEVTQASTNLSTVAGANATANTSTFVAKAGTAALINNTYISGDRCTTTFASTAPEGNTFTVASTSNIFTESRVQTPATVSSPAPFNSNAVFSIANPSVFVTTGFTTNTTGTGVSNIRAFKADSNNDVYTFNDGRGTGILNGIRVPQHPYLTGDPVRYFTNGGNDIGGLTNGQLYYLIKANDNFIQFATSLANAQAGTAIVLTGYGSGSQQYVRGNVFWGNTSTGLNVGHHVNATQTTPTNFTTALPQGSVVLSKRTVSSAPTNSYRGVAFVVGFRDANNNLDETVYASDTYRVGTIGATTGDEAVIQTSGIRGGFGSVGNRIFCDDTTGLAVGMVPLLATNAAGTAGVLVNSPAATVVTSIAVDGKSFTVSQTPSTALFGTRLIAGAGSVSNTLACTATTSGTNVITTSGNTSNIEVNNPVIFTGAPFGTILANTVYYIKTIVSATQFTVSETISGGVAGPVKSLTTGTGTMTLRSDMVYTTSTTGIIPGMSIEMLTGVSTGGTISGGAITDNTRVVAIIDSNRFTITEAPSAQLIGARFVVGVSSSNAGAPANANVYVPSVAGFKVGQLITYISGIAGAFPAATTFATQACIQAVNNTNPLKPMITVGTMVETTGVITVGNAPSTRLQGAVIAAGIGSSTPTTSLIRVPSTVGLNTGMTVAVTAGTGTLATNGALITDINPVNNTFTVGTSPTTALSNASITGTITGAVVTGLYVSSKEPNFPENVTVTAVNGTTITISDVHGGVTSGTTVTFSPFPVGAHVTGVTGTAPNVTVTLNTPHAGIFGGTAVNFSRLPPRTFLGNIPPYVASNWPLRLEFTTPLPVAYTTENRPIVFTGSNKNLGDNVAFKSFGTHVFTRASDADGVYVVEDIPNPTTFVVATSSNIPFNTKSFGNTEVNLTENYIKIQNHKFRDGTSLIYRPGANTLIGTASYTDKDGVLQNTLVSGQTYFAVVVDPNFVKLAPTFDESISPNPNTIDLTSGTNGTQSFDTFSILGLTKGVGTVVVTENSDIVTGIGTKFLTNFKGGDVLRFYTAANPGKIFNYPISSVKSDTSIKLRNFIIPDPAVKVNLITDRTVSAGAAVTTGQQTITLSNVANLAIGYYLFDSVGVFRPNTRITAINETTRVVTLDQYLISSFANNASITIQPVFEYFISTNIYVKSNATTAHRPFDGGVTMTTGLVPDSSVIRQTRKYFRYQSGKGIQVSIAINFNPPTDCEELTSNENLAKVKVDAPHGFKSGSTNKIRITEATVPSGHNGYNGNFDIAEVLDEYSFTYVYEDTSLYGTVTNGTNTITSVWNLAGIAVGKTIKADTYSGITIPENTIITEVNTNTKVITLSNSLTGSSPTVGISSIARLNDTVTVVTSSAHGLVNGNFISISGTGVGANFNGFSAPVTVVDSTTFTYTNAGINITENAGTVIKQVRLPVYRQNGSSVAYGFPKFNLVSWQDASIRCGMFDSQNGMFFEYDGSQLYCVRRSSIQQISGRVNATYRSSLITGEKTKFTTQLNVGEYFVLRGMSYKIIAIDSDTQMYIQPEYRGSTLTNIIGTKTVDTRVVQSQWNIDKADGNGKSGYVIDLNKIQMVYIDYSWYGAGKVRFGIKDQRGEVRYFHEFVHNNQFVEAYMRSGNIPARYEVVTFGEPTFSPQLFHWGTSVIMDGRFDDDKAYLFTADSNIITLTNGGTQVVAPLVPQIIRRNSSTFRVQTINSGKFIVGSSISIQNDLGNRYLPTGTFVQSVSIIPSTNESLVTLTKNFREDITVGGTQAAPTANGQAFNFLVGGGITNQSIAALTPVPLVSIRLAPSVDNGLTGGLGFRDVINRMQLTLNSCGVLLTHECEIKLFLNSDLSDSNFINNTAPSLSQIYKHTAGETIKNGIQLFSFRAGGGGVINTTTGQRSLVQTEAQLGEVAQLGNSILGGDETFPNGPDILTITATPIDTSTINGSAPFQASARITWSESQA